MAAAGDSQPAPTLLADTTVPGPHGGTITLLPVGSNAPGCQAALPDVTLTVTDVVAAAQPGPGGHHPSAHHAAGHGHGPGHAPGMQGHGRRYAA